MSTIRIAFLGDIFGRPGRRVVANRLQDLVREHEPDLVIANAENARHGSGCSMKNYRELRQYGIDGITLGDHCFRESSIIPALTDPREPIARPANLSEKAPGKGSLRLLVRTDGERPVERPVYVIPVLGRVFVGMPANDPFEAVDRFLESLPDPGGSIVIVEAHMEATSEKAALGQHLDGRVAAVIGTHTHVPTADARVLSGGTAFISDVGMCGPYDSIIGRETESVLRYMTTGLYTRFDVGRGDELLSAAVVDINAADGLGRNIRLVQYADVQGHLNNDDDDEVAQPHSQSGNLTR